VGEGGGRRWLCSADVCPVAEDRRVHAERSKGLAVDLLLAGVGEAEVDACECLPVDQLLPVGPRVEREAVARLHDILEVTVLDRAVARLGAVDCRPGHPWRRRCMRACA
jgi:hypothetical protein